MAIKSFWWQDEKYPNLGDELGRIVVERAFEYEVQQSPMALSDLISVGSSLGWALKWDRSHKTLKPLHICGVGFMTSDVSVEPRDYLRIHSVRGYLSKNTLGKLDSPSVSVGDPGLLTPWITSGMETGKSTVKYGIVLHHKHADDTELKDKFSHLPARFIDIRTDDLDAFVSDITSCDVVLSQSLHGLVIADSLGIPNVWLNLGSLHAGREFKFFDYFSTVGREFYKFCGAIPADEYAVDRQIFESSRVRVGSLQREIFNSLDSALCEISNT